MQGGEDEAEEHDKSFQWREQKVADGMLLYADAAVVNRCSRLLCHKHFPNTVTYQWKVSENRSQICSCQRAYHWLQLHKLFSFEIMLICFDLWRKALNLFSICLFFSTAVSEDNCWEPPTSLNKTWNTSVLYCIAPSFLFCCHSIIIIVLWNQSYSSICTLHCDVHDDMWSHLTGFVVWTL